MRYSRAGYWGAAAAGLGVLAIGVVIVTHTFPHGPSLAKAAVLALVGISSMAVSLLSYRSADEVILAEHKTAWFWSSMASCSVIVPLVLAVGWGFLPVPLLLHHLANASMAYFVQGMVFVLLLQCLGFLAILAYLRFRNGAP